MWVNTILQSGAIAKFDLTQLLYTPSLPIDHFKLKVIINMWQYWTTKKWLQPWSPRIPPIVKTPAKVREYCEGKDYTSSYRLSARAYLWFQRFQMVVHLGEHLDISWFIGCYQEMFPPKNVQASWTQSIISQRTRSFESVWSLGHRSYSKRKDSNKHSTEGIYYGLWNEK